MRELLSLRRNEEPIIGEVYRFKNEFLKCVADKGSIVEGCKACCFDVRSCYGACEGEFDASPSRHFELVSKDELETAADVKFRHIEETAEKCPVENEIFIASVGLVELTNIAGTRLNDCASCDLTTSECDSCRCLPHHCYQKVQHITSN